MLDDVRGLSRAIAANRQPQRPDPPEVVREEIAASLTAAKRLPAVDDAAGDGRTQAAAVFVNRIDQGLRGRWPVGHVVVRPLAVAPAVIAAAAALRLVIDLLESVLAH